MVSGFGESLLALLALVYWYSRSVTTWAANGLDSALRGGPERAVPGQAIGFAALVLWLMHPLTWFVAYFVVEGVVRLLAAVSTEQIFGTFPLVLIDWCFGKITGRPLEGDAIHTAGGREQLESFVSAVRGKIIVRWSPEMADEMVELNEGDDLVIEIHSPLPKPEWIPPKTVRIGDSYFRLEQATPGKSPRPFVFRLRGLTAGVPGRTVIVYEHVRMARLEESDSRNGSLR
jgi:hypothetical protein